MTRLGTTLKVSSFKHTKQYRPGILTRSSSKTLSQTIGSRGGFQSFALLPKAACPPPPLAIEFKQVPEESTPTPGTPVRLALPLRQFDPDRDTETPSVLMASASRAGGQCRGWSKWRSRDGTCSWQECTILGFDQDTGRYTIRWDSGKLKQVSRINLRFPEDSEPGFEARISKAEHLKSVAESELQYHAQVRTMTTSTPDFPLRMVSAIVKLLKSNSTVSTSSTDATVSVTTVLPPCVFSDLTQVRRLWRTEVTHMQDNAEQSKKLQVSDAKQHYFARLKPFSVKYQNGCIPVTADTIRRMFPEVEDSFRFAIHQFDFALPTPRDRQILLGQREAPYYGVVENLRYNYKRLLARINCKLHQAHLPSLVVLQRLREQLIESSHTIWFCDEFSKSLLLATFQKKQETQAQQALKGIKHCVFDIQYDLQHVLNIAHAERNERNDARLRRRVHDNQQVQLEMSLSSDFLHRMAGLVEACNILVESQLLNEYQQSVQCFFEQLQRCEMGMTSTLGVNLNKATHVQLLSLLHATNVKFPVGFPCIVCTLCIDEAGFSITPNLDDITAAFHQLLQTPLDIINSLTGIALRDVKQRRKPNVLRLSERSAELEAKQATVTEFLSRNWLAMKNFLNLLKPLTFLLAGNPEAVRAKFTARFNRSKVMDILWNYMDAKAQLDALFLGKHQLWAGMLELRVQKVAKQLYTACESMLETIKEVIVASLVSKVSTLQQLDTEMTEVITWQPANLDELGEIRSFVQHQLNSRMQTVHEELRSLASLLESVNESELVIDSQLLFDSWRAFGVPKQVSRNLVLCHEEIDEKLKLFSVELATDLEKMLELIEELSVNFDSIKKETNLTNFEDMRLDCLEFKTRVDEALERARVINGREMILNTLPTDFSQLENLKKNFTPYFKAWNLIRDFCCNKPLWLQTPLHEVDRESVAEKVEQYSKEISKLLNTYFKGQEEALILMRTVKKKVDKFMPNVPIIQNLKNPGMKDRHWEQLRKLTELFQLNKTLNFTMKDLLKHNVLEHSGVIEKISERASKELVLERQKYKMEREWDETHFTLMPYKGTAFLLIVEPEPLAEMIEDHLLKTSTMCNSPFIEFCRTEMLQWKQMLHRMQNILEEWLKVQHVWQYLYPLFQNKDIEAQLPVAAQKFELVNNNFEVLMQKLQASSLAIDTLGSSLKLLEQLRNASETLGYITKLLNKYLNRKRKLFPRFYFLSNDELLEILSSSKELRLFATFIGKCFEGIDDLRFDDSESIASLISPEKEVVDLVETISINDPETKEVKYVEIWMKEVEQVMKNSLQSIMIEAIADFKETENRIKWIQSWPAQVVHTVNMLVWSYQTETAIEEGEQALPTFAARLRQQLDELVEFLREPLDSQRLLTISTLVVIDVHNRDTVQRLADQHVGNINDFDWLSQLRYYTREETISVHMIDTVRDYGYEYIGNQTRLVMTPLTDRCFQTIMGALRLNLGASPEGPAGTGKTETAKDLAKAMAKKCIVFNCSNRLDPASMGKFFTGLTSCGAWVCFDEFNRIEAAVLSVIAEQVLTIQQALASKVASFMFCEEQVPLDPSCAIIVTMNPGYLGRSELPDNLKVLFRPVAMFVPDSWMIAEILLYSYGFKNARRLSVKLITCFRLASEQLSVQHHYDYGLRSVSAVIRTAGVYKREDPLCDEHEILLQALHDWNVPKFLAEDIQLFVGIMSDLFPSTQLRARKAHEFEDFVYSAMKQLSLSDSPALVKKVIQLRDLLHMRHGVMLVGDSYSCKSVAIEVLARALTLASPDNQVKVTWIFAKAVALENLYGDIDPASNDWYDGILSHHLRLLTMDTKMNAKWIVFDGPVDSIWVETMNTVLDDSKRLCLNSGEIIRLTSEITMLFEVNDLHAASPATISRCGMLYLSREEQLSPEHLLESWLLRVPKGYHFANVQEFLRSSFATYFKPCLAFASKSQLLVEKFSPCWLTVNFLKLFDCMLMKKAKNKEKHSEDFEKRLEVMLREREQRKELEEAEQAEGGVRRQPSAGSQTRSRKDAPKYGFCLEDSEVTPRVKAEILNYLLFSLVWSVGAVMTAPGRVQFNEFLHQLCEESKGDLPDVFHSENCFRFAYSYETKAWQSWAEAQTKTELQLNNFYIDTEDTTAYRSVLTTLAIRGVSALAVGQTGTGKTLLIKQLLAQISADSNKFQFYQNTLSPSIKANQLHDSLMEQLTARTRTTYGPNNSKTLLIVIDDLHMPIGESITGAQPPIEVLRQFVDRRESFNRTTCEHFGLEDLQYLGIASTKHGLTPRLLRHWLLLHFTEFSDEALYRIFDNFLTLGYKDHPDFVKKSIAALTHCTIAVYQAVQARLPPTPTKNHYQFNLRDIANVFRGMVAVPTAKLGDVRGVYRLWAHECRRVFADCLVSETDKEELEAILQQSVERHGTEPWSSFIDGSLLLYCSFIDERVYQESPSMQFAREVLDNVLSDYNTSKLNKPMDLELFDFAVEHIARICRILTTPYGNGLLIGLGGSGRSSLAKLSAFAVNYMIFRIFPTKTYSIVEWGDDLKKVLHLAGVDNRTIAFILRENELVNDAFLDNINNLLNNGEVPGLYTREEKETIATSMKEQRGPSKTSEEKYQDFLVNLRTNLHVIICFSPTGDRLRSSLRLFPSLVTCCTIDWFTDWPQEALVTLATSFVEDSGLLSSPSAQQELVSFCVSMHQSVRNLSKEYFRQKQRLNYVRPTHFLSLFTCIKALYKSKEEATADTRHKYASGVEKLSKARRDVTQLSNELQAKRPVLEQKTQEVNALIEKITESNAAADEQRRVMAAEQQQCAQRTAEAEAIKQECEEALARSIPELTAAVEALRTLDQKDLAQVKSMQSPPWPVRMVVESVVILNKKPAIKLPDPTDTTKFIYDYWEAGKKMMQKIQFLRGLFTFNKDSITSGVIAKLKPYVTDPRFTPEAVRHSSRAAEGLCRWVKALYNYYFISRIIKPKYAAVDEANEELAQRAELLMVKETELRVIEDYLLQKQRHLDEKVQEKTMILQEIELCEQKLKRASELIEALGGEKDRWEAKIAQMDRDFESILGDVVLSAGTVAYLGNFTGDFREQVTHSEWIPGLQQTSIKFTLDFSLRSVVGNPITIQDWLLLGLPNDSVSIDNAIIMTTSTLWPLMIDPQNQANQWIKQLLRQNDANFTCAQPSASDLGALLENSMAVGASFLLENVGEVLSPTLDPLLSQAFLMDGNSMNIQIGGTLKPFDKNFRFYMTTALAKPKYSPELTSQTTLLDFSITLQALSEQLLALVSKLEMPSETKQLTKLVTLSANYIKDLHLCEDRMMALLMNAGEHILEDDDLVNSLTQSKRVASDVERKLETAQGTEARIKSFQAKYRPVSDASSVLYFCTADLANLDPMYVFSMDWFVSIFLNALENVTAQNNLDKHIANLTETVRKTLFKKITLSLFEKDKLVFAFIMAMRLLEHELGLDPQEWKFLLTGFVGLAEDSAELSNPIPGELDEKLWHEVCELCRLPALSSILPHMAAQPDVWVEYLQASVDHSQLLPLETFAELLPKPFDTELSCVQQLCLIRATRPEEMTSAIRSFVFSQIGEFYLKPPLPELVNTFELSTPLTPLIFILTPGNDPQSKLTKFAKENRQTLLSLSLGKGQGEKAIHSLKNCMKTGGWVLLQNCHLALSWLPELQELLGTYDDNEQSAHPKFRLWLTTHSHPEFPMDLLHASFKIIEETPVGLKPNLENVYSSIQRSKEESNMFDNAPFNFKRLLFALSFFHCSVIERQHFGSLGWNSVYEFNDSDLSISIKQLFMMLSEHQGVPYKALRYLVSECNYGGRVTDDWDKRTLAALVTEFYSQEVVDMEYTANGVPDYTFPKAMKTLDMYLEFVKTLPYKDHPGVYGLHANAEITLARKATTDLFQRIMDLQPSQIANTAQQESTLLALAAEIINTAPPLFDLGTARTQYPPNYQQGLNTVLLQELQRFNTLVEVIVSSLDDLQKAIAGAQLMNSDLEQIQTSLLLNTVPDAWMKHSFASCKPLASWVTALKQRVAFFQSWLQRGAPSVFWITAFFFVQGFFTATLQNEARNNPEKPEIDSLNFECTVRGDLELSSWHMPVADQKGCMVSGLFIEGARWNADTGLLDEPIERVLFSSMPVLQLTPKLNYSKPSKVYSCPVYKTIIRRDTVTSSGHVTNYIFTVYLPISDDEAHWVKRGVACLCELDD